MKKQQKKERGVPITVSREAHEIISQKAFNNKPRLNLREYFNLMNNLPKDK